MATSDTGLAASQRSKCPDRCQFGSGGRHHEPTGAPLVGSYDYGEVARSILIAFAASYAALDLGGRVIAARGWVRAAWLTGGAIAMGIGTWSMNFTALLAFRLPVNVEYHCPTVLASLVIAVLASAIALYMVTRERKGPAQAWAGSVIMGSGIAAMHYLGMAAMRLAATTRFEPIPVALSVVLAILFPVLHWRSLRPPRRFRGNHFGPSSAQQ